MLMKCHSTENMTSMRKREVKENEQKKIISFYAKACQTLFLWVLQVPSEKKMVSSVFCSIGLFSCLIQNFKIYYSQLSTVTRETFFFSSQKQGQRDWTQPQTVAMLLKWLLGSSSGSVPVGPKACT